MLAGVLYTGRRYIVRRLRPCIFSSEESSEEKEKQPKLDEMSYPLLDIVLGEAARPTSLALQFSLKAIGERQQAH